MSGTKVNLFAEEKDGDVMQRKERRKIADRRRSTSGSKRGHGGQGGGRIYSGDLPNNPQ